MIPPYEQLDRRFEELRPLIKKAVRPSRGWVRAIREALGMTTAQLASRLNVHQPRVIELERGEASGNITVQTLERAAEALGCQLVYVLIPHRPLTDMIRERANAIALRQLASVDQTMRLEAQEVRNAIAHKAGLEQLLPKLLRKRARLWDEP